MALQIRRSCILAFIHALDDAVWCVCFFFYHFTCGHFKVKEILKSTVEIYIDFLISSKTARKLKIFK